MREQKKEPEYTKQADKYLEGLDAKTEQRLKKAIEKIPLGDIRPFVGTSYSRLRVGDYRLLFKWLNDEQILVYRIGHRGDVYKKGV